MSPAHAAGGRSSGNAIIIAILVTVALLAIIAGIIYFAEPAKSLPSILGTITHPPGRANANRPVRGSAALAVGVVCLLAAWLVGRRSRR